MALDERLHRELERAARPADPSGIYEDLLRRRGRRQVVRRAQRGLLALAVIAGSIAGVYGLSRVFETDGRSPPAIDPSPFPIVPFENGLIAYSLNSSGGMELHAVRPDGTGDRVVPTPPGQPWLHAWSPDGSKLAVAIFPDAGGDRSIWVMNADGSDAREIASAENVSVPSWSPDGETIAYASTDAGRTEIHLWAPRAAGDRVVRAEEIAETFAILSAQFSPDGTKLLFDRGTDSGYDIFVMDIDGSNVQQLTSTGTDYDPHWSPDGSQIAFTRREFTQTQPGSDIFVMSSDGSDVRRLTNGDEGTTSLYPQWAPDGTKIAYMAGVTGGPGPLVVMNADGSEPETLIDGEVLGISWQPLPEGTSIVPSPSPSASPMPEGAQDIGIGFPVCFAERLGRIDYLGDGTDGNAWTAVPVKDDGTCPEHPAPDRYLLAVDHTGDEVADSWIDLPFECWNFCPPIDATDLDGNRTEELIVVNSFSIMDYWVFAVRPSENGDLRVEPILVAAPGHEPAAISAGEPLRIDAGGDAGYGSSIECEGYPSAPVIVWSWSDSEIDSNEPSEVHVTRIELQPDGLFHVIDTNDFTVPAGVPTGIGGQYEIGPQCGVDWWRL